MDIKQLCDEAYETAKSKGFHDEELNVDRALLLIVGEATEALDAINHDRFSNFKAYEDDKQEIGYSHAFDKYVKNSFEDELADIVIRTANLAKAMGIDLEKSIKLKMEYNKTRPYKHGKKF